MNDDLFSNLDKIHTTELGIERIRENLCLDAADVIAWCKWKIENSYSIIKKGKNRYIHVDNVVMTVNARSFTIITAHKRS